MFKTLKESINFTVQMLNNKYKGYYFGLAWDVISPYFKFAAYYFAIKFGLRSGNDVNDVPYLAWLMIGLIPWLFLSGTLVSGARAFISNANFIRTSTINLNVYVLSSIFQNLYTNMIVFIISIVLVIILGVDISIYWLNVIYYYIMMSLFMYSLSTITSVVTVWIRDFAKLLQSTTVLLFWATPILYNIGKVSSSSPLFMKISLFNPFYYFVNGLRDSIFFETNFWETDFLIDIYIIFLIVFNLIIGRLFFKKNAKIIKDII